MDKLLLVDGSYLLFQMYYGMPARIPGKNGAPIHGVIGFIGAVIKTIRQIKPTKILVLFDGESGSDRHTINPDYKANRPDFTGAPDTDNPFAQLPYIYEALDSMGIKNMETAAGYEGDDVIAGYCAKYADTAEMVIMSQDSDFFQLISERVSVYKYRGKSSELVDAGTVVRLFGVAPAQMAEYKALTGDSSDNIRGVPGVGPKTAASLLNEYGSMDGIMESLSNVKPDHIRTAVSENINVIENNLKLIRLDREVKLPFEMGELGCRFDIDKLNTMGVLREIGLVD